MVDTTEVRSKHKFDETSLHLYLKSNLDCFPKGNEVLKIRQFSHGQSNPSFYLQKAGQKFVLRKKPSGQLLKGAHQIQREFLIQSALHKALFPTPKPLLFCADTGVIGTEFYIMEFVEGRIFRSAQLIVWTPNQRKNIYSEMSRVLTWLHSIDWRALGLEDFGRHGNYCARQVSTWSKQYKSSETHKIDSINKLMEWLPNHLPSDDPEATVITHGDYKIDNIVFHPTQDRIIAVLDWELSTLGHPYSDLGYSCLPYHWPYDIPVLPATSLVQILPEGIPTEEEYVAMYCKYRNLTPPIPNWNFFLGLSFFRLAAIGQGVYARALQGNASAENAELFGKVVETLANEGWSIVQRGNEVDKESLASEPSLFQQSAKAVQLLQNMKYFMAEYVYPAEEVYREHLQIAVNCWTVPPIMEELKAKAFAAGLWNLFLPAESGLTQLEYAPLAEITGRSPIGPEVFNCSAPDTGNMEVLHLYGTDEQKNEWLKPLLRGEIRSVFCMTEPDVASSDATNMACEVKRDGNEYVINGKKWWSSGAGDPRCKVAILMGKTENHELPRHKQHSMIIVPMDTPGVNKVRHLTVFGYSDSPHGHFEIHFENVRVPLSNMILGEGRGFEIAQGRLGPGRIHHCMRLIGMSERCLELLCERAASRVAFGKPLAARGSVQQDIAKSRIEIEQARLLTLHAAHTIDQLGTKAARKQVAMIKVCTPRMATRVVDRAIQVFGGAGVCQDTLLPLFYSFARTIRIADGPDEVHLSAIAKMELKNQLQAKL